MDFRKRGRQLSFLEANVIPRIHPTEADLTNMCRHTGITPDDMVAIIVNTAIQRLSIDYKEAFNGKTELLEQIANEAISKIPKAGNIKFQDKNYMLLGHSTRESSES